MSTARSFITAFIITSLQDSSVIGRHCDLGASDVMFVVQSSYDIDKYDFDEVKEFMKAYVSDLDVGFEQKQTRIGVVLFDKSREPEYRLKLNQLTKRSDVQKAIASIHRLPCGYWWCKTDLKRTPKKAVDFAMKILKKESGSRMRKLIVILNGKQPLRMVREIGGLPVFDPLLRVVQILVVPDITEADDPYYRYLLSYYQPYERYLGRIHQLYPNVSLPDVHQTYNPNLQLPYSKQTKDGVITLQSYEFICTIRRDVCNMLFACPPCSGLPTLIFGTPLEKRSVSKSSDQGDTKNYMDDGLDSTSESPFLLNRWISNSEQPATHPSLEPSFSQTSMGSIGKSRTSELQELSTKTANGPEDVRRLYQGGSMSVKFQSSRQKRQAYSIYPSLSQQHCTCPIATSKAAEVSENLKEERRRVDERGESDKETGEVRNSTNIMRTVSSFPSAAHGCRSVFAEEGGFRGDKKCTGHGEDAAAKRTDEEKFSSGPLSRAQFEKCLRGSIVAEHCSFLKTSDLSPFPPVPDITGGETASFAGETAAQSATELLTTAASPLMSTDNAVPVKQPLLPSEFSHKAGYDKWLGANSELLMESQPHESLRFGALNGLLRPNKTLSTERSKERSNTMTSLRSIQPWFIRNVKIVEAANKRLPETELTGDVEEFVAEPNTVNSFSTKPNVKQVWQGGIMEFSSTKADERSFEQTQGLVALDDSEPGPIPKLVPPTLPLLSRIIEDAERVVHAPNLGRFGRRHSPLRKTFKQDDASAAHLSSSGSSKKRRKLLSTPELLSTHSLKATRRCMFTGIDVLVYVDDSNAMTEADYLRFRNFLKQLLQSFETDRRECERISRLGILKNRQDGTVFTYLHLDEPMNGLQKAIHISKMERTACNIQSNTQCAKALPNAYVLAVNLLTQEYSDRKRILIVATARSKKQVKSVHYDLLEALDFASRNKIDVLAFGLGQQIDAKSLISLTTSEIVIIPQLIRKQNGEIIEQMCKRVSVSEDDMKRKRKYCPWKPLF